MSRSEAFQHNLHPSVELVQDTAHGSLPFFIPTTAQLTRHHAPEDQITWNSRDHRKQRHRAASPRRGRGRHVDSTWARIARMRRLEYWNISWWVAVLFTIGSVVWVINGFQIFMPFITSVAVEPVGSAWSAWVGATIFVVGSILLILEAWNRNDAAYFGYAVEKALKGQLNKLGEEEELSGSNTSEKTLDGRAGTAHQWIWWSTDRKYWHELGFVAGFSQLCGATIFWICGFTGLPEILSVLERNTGALDGAFWTPQVIGGTGFIISSTLYMLETQNKWYIPAPTSLGWHIGFWNLIGGIGFTLCGAFGYSTKSELVYQSALSTFWGSWAFLIGSVIQWYEAVNPVRASVAS